MHALLHLHIILLFHLSCQTHADSSGRCGGGDAGRVHLLLVAIDVELEGGSVITHVDGDIGTHYQRQVHVAMTAGEAAEHGDIVVLQQLMEHGLDALVGELLAAVGELAEDDAAAAVEHAVHLENAHLTVDVVHRLLHLLDEEDEVLALGGVGLRAEVRCEGADIAAHQIAGGLARDVLLVCGQLVAGHFS